MGLNPHCMMMKAASKEHTFQVRKAVVLEAQRSGIKPAMRKWGIARNTIRTWLRRFESMGNKGLEDQRQGPKNIPHKTSKEIEDKVINARLQVPCYGPKRLQYFFELPCSQGAIQRIVKAHGLVRKRKKKYQKKNDLRAHKAAWKAGTRLQMDVKHLYDIPNYWGLKRDVGIPLPKYQYTMRDVKSGMAFLGFSDEISELNARTMVDHFLQHLAKHLPFSIEELVFQTDNGVEFGGTTRHFERSPFTQFILSQGAQHVYIPPGMSNANGDIESFHDTIEEEFFDLTGFNSREDFMQKAESYRLFYNLRRPNYSKGAKTPAHIAQEDWPDCDFSSFAAAFPTLDLDKLNILLNVSQYNRKGQSIPVFRRVLIAIRTAVKKFFKMRWLIS
jgi:transposase InsO family protein